MPHDFADLVTRATNGDRAAVDELLAQHLPALKAFVRLKAGAMLLAKESCSDLAQSVCRDVLENADRFRFGGEAEFRKWLFTTAMRKIADRAEHWGAGKRDPRRERPEVDEEALAGYRSIATPSHNAAAREELERVEAAFARLDADKQELVLMARLFGMTSAEIAADTGKTEGAVRTALSRALADLARLL